MLHVVKGLVERGPRVDDAITVIAVVVAAVPPL